TGLASMTVTSPAPICAPVIDNPSSIVRQMTSATGQPAGRQQVDSTGRALGVRGMVEEPPSSPKARSPHRHRRPPTHSETGRAAIRRKQAGLPAGKTFDSWREDDSSIPAPTQSALATLEWVHRAENLAISGPSGTGKTHFLEALAHKVIDAGMRASWF